MNNISVFSDCYGCGVCVMTCPKKVITLTLNEDGFYGPYVRQQYCTDCGLCLAVCAYADRNVLQSDTDIKAYAAWSQDSQVRKKCSSGGVGFELGRYLLEKGYKVCGVRYNPDLNRAEHYMAFSIDELIPSMGSKYIQSFTVDGFLQVNRKDEYLITGTPCQIDSFRRYIQKYKIESHFVLMDFFCHGVPSMLMWNKYLKEVEKEVGKVVYASWRNKFTGWHDSWAMAIDGERVGEKVNWHDSYNMLIRGRKTFYNSRLSQGDLFYRMFLSNTCLGKACYDRCKYKYLSSAADIRIGDLWGKTYRTNEDGVTGVVAFTKRGWETLKSIPSLVLIEHPIDIIVEGQMKKRIFRPALYPIVRKMLRTGCSIYAFRPVLFMCELIKYLQAAIKKNQNENSYNNLP